MEITITKDDFEKALPVGTSAHEEVYESVRPAIDDALRFSDIALLGDAGMEVMESKGGDTLLQDMYKQTVCLSAFLGVLRQLDLVLTPTGFGVVSNDNLTPASKMRVDALEAQLRTRYDKALALTLHLLRSGREALRQPAFRRLMRALDSDDNAALFQPYRQSAAYKANHHEPYRNTKDSAGYVFNG